METIEAVYYVVECRTTWWEVPEDATPADSNAADEAGSVTECVIGIYLSKEEAESKHPNIGLEKKGEAESGLRGNFLGL